MSPEPGAAKWFARLCFACTRFMAVTTTFKTLSLSRKMPTQYSEYFTSHIFIGNDLSDCNGTRGYCETSQYIQHSSASGGVEALR